MKLATDLKESKRLVEMGFAPESADMTIVGNNDMTEASQLIAEPYVTVRKGMGYNFSYLFPAWSATALMNTIPVLVELYKSEDNFYCCSAYGMTSEWYESQVSAVLEIILRKGKSD